MKTANLLKHHPKFIVTAVGILLTLLVFLSGAIAGYNFPKQIVLDKDKLLSYLPVPYFKPQKDVYTAFLLEVYDKIKDNYWEDLTDEQLSEIYKQSLKSEPVSSLYKKGADKYANSPRDLPTKDKQGLKTMFDQIFREMDEDKKKEFSINLTSVVLASLKPAGRSGLYTTKLEQNLKNIVSNINPDKDLYKDLGVEKNAPVEKVEEAYKNQNEKLEQEKAQTSEPEKKAEVQKKIEAVKYAKDVLSSPERKQKYDTYGIEPTVFTRLVKPGILHLQIKKMSPTTFDEFQRAISTFNKEDGPDTLIFDLRGNIGGALDIVPLLTGAFLGKNQYAFDLFAKGKYEPIRTTIDKLPGTSRYKQIVVLIDGQGQSSAEITAVTYKRYNLGILVGKKTKGWGTVEKVYPLESQITSDEKYSVFLVNHITLRDDGQPIEGRGVEPMVDTDDPNWKKELYSYSKRQDLVDATSEVLTTQTQ